MIIFTIIITCIIIFIIVYLFIIITYNTLNKEVSTDMSFDVGAHI